jgi:spermidine/putrescine transport system permease protein
MKTKAGVYPYLVWTAMFVLIPMVLVGFYAFTDKSGAGTAANVERFFTDPVYLQVVVRSALNALACTVICLLLGYPVAAILAGPTFRHKETMILLLVVPMWMNFLVRTYAWLSLLENNGLINTFLSSVGLDKLPLLYNNGSVIMGMVYNFLPFMILPIYSVLTKIDRSVIQAAEDLGANRRKVFLRVTLPLSMPGVMSGVTMVFMPAVTTFVISRLMGGGKTTMVGDLIERQFLTVYDWNFGSAVSFVMMVVILLTMAVMSRFESEDKGEAFI